jgi:hypothetical protein
LRITATDDLGFEFVEIFAMIRGFAGGMRVGNETAGLKELRILVAVLLGLGIVPLVEGLGSSAGVDRGVDGEVRPQ